MNPVLSLYENRSATEKTRHPLSGTRHKAPRKAKISPATDVAGEICFTQFVQRERRDQARAAVMMAIL